MASTEQVARATVGPGEIIVRDNPEQDLSKLNRNPDLALTETSPFWSGWSIDLKDPIKSFDKVTQTAEDVAAVSNKIAEKGFNKVWHDIYEENKAKVQHEWNKVATFFEKTGKKNTSSEQEAYK